MSDMTPLPKDSPIMQAWEAFKQTEEYANAKKWASATHGDRHLAGSLWALFTGGWQSRERVAVGSPPVVVCHQPRAEGDVYEIRPTAKGWCVPAGVHNPRRVQSLTTRAGTVYVCEACGSHWLVPWENNPAPTNKVLDDIRRRRERQIAKHGRVLEHDDLQTDGSLAIAAIPYIESAYMITLGLTEEELQTFWPFEEAFKPGKDRREAIENAAALLVAELERIDRAAGKAAGVPK